MKPLSRGESVIAVALTSIVVIILVLWVLSYWYTIVIGWDRSRYQYIIGEYKFRGLYVQKGRVGVGGSAGELDPTQPRPPTSPHPVRDERRLVFRVQEPHESPWIAGPGTPPQDLFAWLGFEHVHNSSRSPYQVVTDRALFIPWWFVFLFVLGITVRWTFFRERRLFWRKRNRCAACGYDLRESRDRCPECGLKVGSPGAGARVDRVED